MDRSEGERWGRKAPEASQSRREAEASCVQCERDTLETPPKTTCLRRVVFSCIFPAEMVQ